MLKKLLAVIMLMAVLVSSFTGIQVSAADEDGYEPKGLMIQTEADPSSGSMLNLTWKNPSSDTLTGVKLYDITGASPELLADESILTGKYNSTITDDAPVLRNGSGVVQYIVKNLTAGVYKKYKIVFSFSDTADKTYYLAGAPVKVAANANVYLTDNLYTQSGRASGSYPYPPLFAETVTEQDGNTALKLTSNIGAYVSNNWSQIRYKVTGLTVGNKYQAGFRYKSETGSKPKFNILDSASKCAADITVYNGKSETESYREWTDFTSAEYTAAKTDVFLRINFENPIEYIMVDDFYIREILADGSLGENLITDGGMDSLKAYRTAAAATPEAVPQNESAVISWENDANASYYKLYRDGSFIGVAYPDPSGTTSYTAQGLENGTEYTFGVAAYNKNFTPGDINSVPVTPQKPEEPAPASSMISNLALNTYTYGGTGGALTVSFKNPKVDDITSIGLYDVNGDKEALVSGTDFSTASGAANYYTIGGLTNGTLYKYKLRVTTASGGLTEYDIAGKPAAGAYSMNFNTDGTNHYWKKEFVRENGNTAYPPIDFKVMQNPDSQESDYVLNVVSNLKAYSAKTFASLTYNFTDQMTAGTTYRLKFKYKTLADGARPKIAINNSELGYIDLNSNGWQSASFDFADKNAATNVIKISFTNPLEGIYLDKFELVPVVEGTEGKNILTKGDFDIAAEETPAFTVDTVNAEASHSSAKIDYTVSAIGKFVRIYEKTEDGLNLISVEQPTAKSGTVTLNNLTNDKTYNLVVTTSNWKDIESAGYEFSVTPVPLPVDISEFVLTKDGSAVQSLTAGTHSAKVSIKNNRMGDGYTAQLIAAVYDGNKLISAKASNVITIPQTASVEADTVLTVDDIVIPSLDSGAYTVKLMLWDSLDDMNPLEQFRKYTE